MRIDHLLVKAKTLNFRKINIYFFGRNVISRKSNNRPLFSISKAIENDSCFRSTNHHFLFDRLEFPSYVWLGLSFEFDDKFFEVND